MLRKKEMERTICIHKVLIPVRTTVAHRNPAYFSPDLKTWGLMLQLLFKDPSCTSHACTYVSVHMYYFSCRKILSPLCTDFLSLTVDREYFSIKTIITTLCQTQSGSVIHIINQHLSTGFPVLLACRCGCVCSFTTEHHDKCQNQY